MGRRIEVELTSAKGDGTWTWRAAGARQPKGVVDAALLYEGARVGDVVRADADFEIEGITITAILPPKEKKRSEPERLEVIGPPREHQGVTSSLVAKSDRPRAPRGREGERGRASWDGGGGERRNGGASRPRDDASGRPGGARSPRPEARPRPEGRPRPDGGHPRPAGTPASGARRPERPARAEIGQRPAGRERRREAPPTEAVPKPKRLAPANVHRAAVVEALLPEQRPIAEQVLRGGIPAVRQAVETQNARLREEGQPEVHAAALVAMAEQILPQLKAAEWRDRAEAAAKVVDDVSLRDLRSVVSGADLARDDEGRILAGTLRQALERRLEEQRGKWLADIASSLDEGRLVRALRLSAHPPDASRFPSDLAVRLNEAAGAAMTADVTPDRWSTLLEAVAESPVVRRTVKPVALPAEQSESLLQAARQASGRVPALAALLGISMPPPPGPPRPGRPGARPTRSGSPPAPRRPPPPAVPGVAPGVPTVAAEPAKPAEAPAEPAGPTVAAEPAGPADATAEPAGPTVAAEPAEAAGPADATAEPPGAVATETNTAAPVADEAVETGTDAS